MIAANEVVEGTPIARMRVVRSPPTPDKLADAVRRIELAIDSFDQVTLMAALSSLVPEYDRATRAETEQCRP